MTEGPDSCVDNKSIVKNYLLNKTCDSCCFSFVKDGTSGPKLHCTNKKFLENYQNRWTSFIVPKERTCGNWSGVFTS